MPPNDASAPGSTLKNSPSRPSRSSSALRRTPACTVTSRSSTLTRRMRPSAGCRRLRRRARRARAPRARSRRRTGSSAWRGGRRPGQSPPPPRWSAGRRPRPAATAATRTRRGRAGHGQTATSTGGRRAARAALRSPARARPARLPPPRRSRAGDLRSCLAFRHRASRLPYLLIAGDTNSGARPAVREPSPAPAATPKPALTSPRRIWHCSTAHHRHRKSRAIRLLTWKRRKGEA